MKLPTLEDEWIPGGGTYLDRGLAPDVGAAKFAPGPGGSNGLSPEDVVAAGNKNRPGCGGPKLITGGGAVVGGFKGLLPFRFTSENGSAPSFDLNSADDDVLDVTGDDTGGTTKVG